MSNHIHGWRIPFLRNSEDEREDRKATWLELFYDLIFVIAIFELSHVLSDKLTWTAVFNYTILFVPVWWVWLVSTVYNNRFETEDVSQRVFVFLKILSLTAMALFLRHGADTTAVGFVVSYIITRLILIGMWLRAGFHNPKARSMTDRYFFGFTVSIAFWVLSLFFPPPVRYIFWVWAIVIDILTPILIRPILEKMPRLDPKHIIERYGLFVLIAIGEVIISVFLGVSDAVQMASTGVLVALGIGIAFGLWWIYFDSIMERRFEEKSVVKTIAWSYLHLPLLMSIVAVGAGVLLTIQSSVLTSGIAWLLSASLSATLITLGLLELTLKKNEQIVCDSHIGKSVRFGGALLALSVGLFHVWLTPLLALLILILVLAIQIVFENIRHIH